MKINIILLILFSFLFYGCSSIKQHSILKVEELPSQSPTNQTPVLIAADLQVHYFLQPNTARRNSKDSVSEAIRPIAADLFAPINFNRELNRFVKNYPDNRMIFLGDMLDVACQSELEYFLELMKTRSNWVMAPGNHDAIFMGVFEKSNVGNAWRSACDDGSGSDRRVSKPQFIFSYLHALAQQATVRGADPSFARFKAAFVDASKDRRAVSPLMHEMIMQHSEDKGIDRDCPKSDINLFFVNCKVSPTISEAFKKIPNHGWWRNKSETKDTEFLQDIFWYINPMNPMNSFIIQKVRLPDGRFAVLLDTINPSKNRDLSTYVAKYNPANSANMLDVQVNALAKLMNATQPYTNMEKKTIKKSLDKHILMAHHPVKDFVFRAKPGLCHLIYSGNVDTMFTAHTHSSFIASQNLTRLFGNVKCDPIQEINIGSLIDSNIEFAMLYNYEQGKYDTPVLVDLQRQYETKLCSVGSDPDIKKWVKENDYYTSYIEEGFFASSDKIHRHLMVKLIDTYTQMLNPEFGFVTTSDDWPQGYSSDSSVRDALESMRSEIQKGSSLASFVPALNKFQKFFVSRKVADSERMDKFVTCNLLWASNAKKNLSFWDRIF